MSLFVLVVNVAASGTYRATDRRAANHAAAGNDSANYADAGANCCARADTLAGLRAGTKANGGDKS